VRVVTEGITGPEIVVTLVDAAPALFSMTEDTSSPRREGQFADADNPAHAGDTVVILHQPAWGGPRPTGGGRDSRLRGPMLALAR